MSLALGLLANNSNGVHILHMDCEEEGLHLTLTGDYRGEDIQIDFDTLDKEDLDLFIKVLTSHKERL